MPRTATARPAPEPFRDRAAGRTLAGPQASDLVVRHGPKDVPAATASTGEQKALLIGLVLAHARLVTGMSGLSPLVLSTSGGPSRSPPPRRPVRRAGGPAGAGLDDGADPVLFGSWAGGRMWCRWRRGACSLERPQSFGGSEVRLKSLPTNSSGRPRTAAHA